MAYTIIKSDGTVLTTIADGTLNTTSTSISLPGRDYSGYGRYLDSNFVWMLENFANNTPPSNPIRGQLWFNTNDNTLYVCPADGTTNPSLWIKLSVSQGNTSVSFDNITATGNILGNNITASNSLTANSLNVTTIYHGTSNISIPSANGNINFSIGGQSNEVVLTSTGANINGYLSVSGNANVANIGAINSTFTNVVANSNITSSDGYFVSANANLGYWLRTSAGSAVGKVFYNQGAVKVEAIDTTSNVQLAANGTVRLSVFANGSTTINGPFYVTTNVSIANSGYISSNNAIELGGFWLAPFYNAKLNDFSDGSAMYLASINAGSTKSLSADAYYYNSTQWRSNKTTGAIVNLVNGEVKFYTDTGLTPSANYSPTQRMVINTSGNIGIANSAPVNTLAVNGTAYISGNVNIGTTSSNGNANNISTLIAGTFESISGANLLPYDDGMTPVTYTDLFTINTTTVPKSAWILTFNTTGYSSNVDVLQMSATYMVYTSGVYSHFVNLTPTSNILLFVSNTASTFTVTAAHNSSVSSSRFVEWSALKIS